MNKQKKTTLIKISLLFTFLLFLSCNDDLYNNHEHNHGENKNKITLSQFKSETKIKYFKTIIKSNIQAMKSTNRTAELSDFVIDTIAIQRHISQNNKTTYSFRIYPISGISLSNENYNLVYRLENNNWEQSIFLIKTNANLEFSEINHLYDSYLESNSVNLRAYTACISTTPVTYCTGQSVCADRCDATTSAGCPNGECYRYVITTIGDCSTGGGGSSDPNNGNPSDNSQSGYLPTNPYEFTPNMFDNPVYDDPNYVNAIKAQHFFSNLSYAQQVWANENVENYNQLIQYRIDNNWSDESEQFVEWVIIFMFNNSNVTWQQFQNWFMGQSEGRDFEYDEQYWENPSLTFPQQNLPTYNDFFNAYPKNQDGSWMVGADNVYAYVGGSVQQARITYRTRTENTCALKVSIALNGAGITIPNIPGQTLQGGGQFANQYFFLNARALNIWMRKTFGTTSNPNYMNIPASQITANGENLPTLLANIKGIYSLVCPLGSTWATGHADIIDNTICAANCHFYDAPIEYIDIWKLN